MNTDTHTHTISDITEIDTERNMPDDISNDEEIDIAARKVLKRFNPAFVELAK